MFIPNLNSIRTIEQQFDTGEKPVLVLCSDLKSYICKYKTSQESTYKLVCELVGDVLATTWQIDTPNFAFVHIRKEHWNGFYTPKDISTPTIGSERLEGVVDITPSTYREIDPSYILLKQLLKIALFDFWIANEDRNANNANLLYDINKKTIISIDYGCIFNTATFDYSLSQLTSTDTILSSGLFHHIIKEIKLSSIKSIVSDLQKDYRINIDKSYSQFNTILEALKKEWNIPYNTVSDKLNQLTDKQWVSDVWDNFWENLKENFSDEQTKI